MAASKKERENTKSKYGINGVASSIMNIPFIGDHFPLVVQPDTMHDCLHGMAEYCLITFFKSTRSFLSFKGGKITAAMVNEAIVRFCKLSDAKEKYLGLPIPNFRDDFTINLSASQLRVLISRLPFIISQIAPKLPIQFYETEEWKIVILFSRIISFLFAPILLDDDIDLLEHLIAKFLERYSKRYGSSEFKNKFHHLIHYPNSIRMYGPSRYACTLPNERSLSKIAKNVHSRKNPLKQAMEHLKFQTIWYVRKANNFNILPSVGVCVDKAIKSKKHSRILIDSVASLIPNDTYLISPLEYLGCFFAPGLIICQNSPIPGWLTATSVIDKKAFDFWMIKALFVSTTNAGNRKLGLVCMKLRNNGYVPQFGGISVILTDEHKVIQAENLEILKSFSMHKIRNPAPPSLLSPSPRFLNIVFVDSLPFKVTHQIELW